jgi:hypothetical protein
VGRQVVSVTISMLHGSVYCTYSSVVNLVVKLLSHDDNLGYYGPAIHGALMYPAV